MHDPFDPFDPIDDDDAEANQRPRLGGRIARGLSLIQALLVDHIARDRTSTWWRGLTPEQQHDARHALEYLIRLLDWDARKREERERDAREKEDEARGASG